MGKLARLIYSTSLAIMLAPLAADAQNEDGYAFMALPDTTIPGQQVGWFVNSSRSAMVDAVENQRPLIMVFGDETSPLTIQFARYVAPCPHINQLAGAATFAYGSPLVDEDARLMAARLGIESYPFIAVIEPRTDDLVSLHNMEGIFTGEQVGHDLYLTLAQNGYWRGDPPPTLPTHYLAYPNLGCTQEGFERLGLGAN